jgi:hypothetical protein
MKNIYHLLLCSFILLGISMQAQSPGGVTGAQVWFKSYRLPNTQFAWKDYAGDGVKLNYWNSTNEYSNQGRYFNFNAGLYFDGGSRQFFMKQTNLSQGTIIGAYGHLNSYFNYENTLFGITGRPNEGAIITNDKVVNSTERDGTTLDYGSTNGEDLFRKQDNSEGVDAKYRERALKIVSYYQYQQPNISVWGEDETSSLTLGYGYLNTANGLSSYNMSNFYNNFYGYIPELLVYSRVLNPLERRKAETYLAIKYGVSLSDSYISSDDKLIWDWSVNANYNNRIFGLIRDDKSGISQLMATTSYEEASYYSDQYDSYKDQDPKGKPSAYRLLVFGQSPGNGLDDTNFVLCGDDNAAITSKEVDGMAGLKRMSRKWKLNTNKVAATTAQKTLSYTNTGLSVVADIGKSTFTNSTAASTGTSVTATPLQGPTGYLEFKPTTIGGTMIVKFGTQNGAVSASDYGIKIEPNGILTSIENTMQPSTLGVIIANYYKITLEKKGNEININVYDSNGNKAIATKTLTVLAADSNKLFYGVVTLEKKTTDVSLTLKHGGFVDTGSQIELSYDNQIAAEFANNTTKSYLIIDRSGTGNFPTGKVDYYPVDDLDPSRKKLIFNTVFWDTDGNGKDVFSFGYRDSSVKLIATEQAVSPTCLNNVLQQDGKINIEIKEGLPGYKYSLNKTGSTAVLDSGVFYEATKTLTNLTAGDYDVTLEMIGTNFEKSVNATGIATVATTTALPANTNGSLEWVVTDFNADKYIGFIDQKTNLNNSLLNYGVQLKQDKLYFWNKGIAGTTPLATLIKGSKIKLERQGNNIICSLNGTQVGSQTIAATGTAASYYGFVALDAANNSIYNLLHTGFVISPLKLAWTSATNLTVTEGDATTNKVIQKVTILPTECIPVIVVPPIVVIADKLLVSPIPSKANANFNVYVSLDNTSEVMVLIFNAAGGLITQLRNATPQKGNTFVTSLPTAGIYIIKVLTEEGEFTKTIIIQ